MVEHALCTRISPHLNEPEAIVPCNFSFFVLRYVTSYTYICHMLMINSFAQMSETDVSPCSIARSVYEHQVTKVTSLPMRLTQQTFGDNEWNCEQMSESPHLSFSRVPSVYPVFLDVNQRVLPDSPDRFIPHWKISYLNLLFPFIFDLC